MSEFIPIKNGQPRVVLLTNVGGQNILPCGRISYVETSEGCRTDHDDVCRILGDHNFKRNDIIMIKPALRWGHHVPSIIIWELVEESE